jgi:hypothetical protein
MRAAMFFGLLAIALVFAYVWLTRRARLSHDSDELLHALSADDLLPRHYRFFPQVRKALTTVDESYLALRADAEAHRRATMVRRRVAMEFLRGLREDYQRFNRLARALTALAPEANPQREMERIRLSIRFRLNWGIVWLRLVVGAAPIEQIQRLSDQVGSLSARLEGAIRDWQDALAASQATELKV